MNCFLSRNVKELWKQNVKLGWKNCEPKGKSKKLELNNSGRRKRELEKTQLVKEPGSLLVLYIALFNLFMVHNEEQMLLVFCY